MCLFILRRRQRKKNNKSSRRRSRIGVRSSSSSHNHKNDFIVATRTTIKREMIKKDNAEGREKAEYRGAAHASV